jgi:hypothetical protein
MLLIEDFLHGQKFNQSSRPFVKCGALGIGTITERDEKSARAILTLHHRLEHVDALRGEQFFDGEELKAGRWGI